MTWLRWEADSAFTDVVDELAATLKIPAAHAYGLYVATCNGFGRFRKDGNVAAVLRSALEGWARWKGRPGRWAAAFRDRCADESGILRGWWRNAAVLRKQEKDASRPPSNQRGNRGGIAGESGGIPRGNLAGDGGRRTDTGTELPLPSNLPPRLAQRLIGEPGRFAIWDFLEAVPRTSSIRPGRVASWDASTGWGSTKGDRPLLGNWRRPARITGRPNGASRTFGVSWIASLPNGSGPGRNTAGGNPELSEPFKRSKSSWRRANRERPEAVRLHDVGLGVGTQDVRSRTRQADAGCLLAHLTRSHGRRV